MFLSPAASFARSTSLSRSGVPLEVMRILSSLASILALFRPGSRPRAIYATSRWDPGRSVARWNAVSLPVRDPDLAGRVVGAATRLD
jgi:hypothetical protein